MVAFLYCGHLRVVFTVFDEVACRPQQALPTGLMSGLGHPLRALRCIGKSKEDVYEIDDVGV